MKRLLTFLLVVSLTVPDGRAQSDTTTVFQIDSLPLTPQGVLLDKGWKWHAGDKPDWARADFDDSKWENIDPSKDIMYLPQVRKAGIGWLRLNLHVDNSILQKKAPAFMASQVGASELFCNGQLVKQFGKIRGGNNQADAVYTLYQGIDLPAQSLYVLAIRVQYQAKLPYNKMANRSNSLFSIRVIAPSQIRIRGSIGFINYVYLRIGVFFMLAFLHFFFFVFYPAQKANLFFATSALLFFYHWLDISLVWNSIITDLETVMYIGLLRALLYPIGYVFLVRAFYSAFNLARSFYFYLSLSVCALLGVVYIFNYETGVLWLEIGSTLVMTAEALRVTLLAIKRKRRGSGVILFGLVLSLVGIGIRYLIDFTPMLPYLKDYNN